MRICPEFDRKQFGMFAYLQSYMFTMCLMGGILIIDIIKALLIVG